MIYLELLWSFFQIGLFSIGGGYAAMPANPESGGGCSFLAYNDTVCGYHDDCGNDAWTYCH